MLKLRYNKGNDEPIYDFTAYVKQENGQYINTSMRKLFFDIFLQMKGYIDNANYLDNTMTFLYKDGVTGEVLSFQPFAKDINQIFGSGGINNIIYNPSHFIQNKSLLTSRPVWSSRHMRFGHRGTLITKRHVIYQNHSLVPRVGDYILFLDENNQKVMRTVINRYDMGQYDNGNTISSTDPNFYFYRDIGIVRLNEDVPDTIKPAMFIGRPYRDFLIHVNNHRARKYISGTENIGFFKIFYQYFYKDFRVRDSAISPDIAKPGTSINSGFEDHTHSFYLPIPLKIWTRQLRDGDSGHAEGFFYKNRYIVKSFEGDSNHESFYYNEYRHDHPIDKYYIPIGSTLGIIQRVSLREKIQEWEGSNSHNYEVDVLTKYSV